MLIAATAIFVYYTVWTLFMVRTQFLVADMRLLACSFLTSNTLTHAQPFVDEDHVLHSLFLPRVWAIRVPVILLLLGGAVVGSFLSLVMVRSNRKKAAKAAKAMQGKKQ